MKDKIKHIWNNCSYYYQKAGIIISKFFYKHIHLLAALLITALALTIRYLFAEYQTNDFQGYIMNWMSQIKNIGFTSFYQVQSDYSPLYMFFIALLTLLPTSAKTLTYGNFTYPISWIYEVKTLYFISDVLIAFIIYLILRQLKLSRTVSLIGYLIMLLLPIQIINSSVWGNCDTLYSFFCLTALYLFLKKRDYLSLFVLGIGLGLKLQATFVIPFFVLMIVKRKMKLSAIPFIFIGLFITFIPSYIIGAPFSQPFTYITNQLNGYKDLTLGCANIWKFINLPQIDIVNKASTIFALTMVGLFMAIIVLRKIKINSLTIINIFVFLTMLMPFFLPHMHERYFYIIDVSILIYCLVNKKQYYLIILMQISSAIAYYHYLSGHYFIDVFGEDSVTIAALINLFVLGMLFKNLLSAERYTTFNEEIAELDNDLNTLNEKHSK